MKDKLKLTRGTVKKVAGELGVSLPTAWARIHQSCDPVAIELAARFEEEHRKKQNKAIASFKKATSIPVTF